MKTLKLLIVLCFIFAFSTNNVKAQKETGTQSVDWSFSPNQGEGRFQIPCLTEFVSGPVTEYQSFTNDTYHVRASGVLYGPSPSKEDYEISYEYNSYGINYPANSFAGSGNATHYLYVLPMLLKHDGKIVAVIHLAGQYVINGNGEIVQDFYIRSVNCK
jgi:hypothetical protein